MSKIEKGLWVLPHGNRIYPWEDMNIGDSFFIRNAKSAGSRVSSANKRYKPRKFISRSVKDGVRIWRIK